MENTIGSRIDSVVRSLEMKKVQFAERLKIDQSYVTQLTNGKRNPSDRLISDICREFNVSEDWLRTGNGQMFRPISRSQELTEFVGKILKGDDDNFKRCFVAVLAQLDESEWELIEKMAKKLSSGEKKIS